MAKEKIINNTEALEKFDTPMQAAFKNFFRNKLAIAGLVVFVSIFLFVFIGSSMTKYDPYYDQTVLRNIKPGFGYLNFPSELNGKEIKKISTGITFSVALDTEGDVYMWGVDYNDVLNPPQEVLDRLENETIVDIAAGDRHVIVLNDRNEIFGWGHNFFGQTSIQELIENKDGHRGTCPPGGCPESLTKDNPGLILQNEKIIKIEAADLMSAALTENGNLVIWGAVENNRMNRVPSDVQGNIADFELSTQSVIVLLEDGSVRNFGISGNIHQSSLTDEIRAMEFTDIAITYRNAFGLTPEGEIVGWGYSLNPTMNIPEFESKVVKIDGGREHMVALLEDGSVVTWGDNEYGQTKTPNISNGKEIFANFFQTYATTEDDQVEAWGHNGFPLGADERGRDLFVRLLHGGRISLTIGAIAVIIQVTLGSILGMISGFYGGRVDNLIQRIGEIIGSFPFYPLVITLSAMLPPGYPATTRMIMIMLILGFTGWPGISRLVRGQILQEREKDFVLAAKALGIRERNIVLRHILPNVLNIVIVQVTLGYASSLLIEAGLSFLGFGVQYPFPSWGNMLTDAQSVTVIEEYWWRWVFPGFMVFLTALSINIIGDGLRDALDPKSSEK